LLLLHFLDHTWTPLTKWCHTGPLEAVLCSVCHTLKDIRSRFRINSPKLYRTTCAESNVAINGHTSPHQDILYHCWPFLTTLHLLDILRAMWTNLFESIEIGKKLVMQALEWLEYIISTRIYDGAFYATLDQICSIQHQRAIPAVTWCISPRFVTSASVWTKSLILHILNHTWSPITKLRHTGSLEAALCNVFKPLSSKDVRSPFKLNSTKLTRMSCAASNVAINGHTSLQLDVLYHCRPFLASLHLLLGFLLAMWSNLVESVEIGQNWYCNH